MLVSTVKKSFLSSLHRQAQQCHIQEIGDPGDAKRDAGDGMDEGDAIDEGDDGHDEGKDEGERHSLNVTLGNRQ